MKLPEWAQREENYNPGRDRDYFISRSLLRLVSILKALRQQHGPSRWAVGAGPALVTTLMMILLVVLCRTMAFLWAVLAGELVLLAFHPGRQLRTTLAAALAASAVCAVIVAPAFFLGNGQHVYLLPCKTCLTVLGLMLLQQKCIVAQTDGGPAGLSRSVPDHLHFGYDPALHRHSRPGIGRTPDGLEATLRRQNPDKKAALSGVAGIMLQKSQRLSQDLYEAMRCRGFTGEYQVYDDGKKTPLVPGDGRAAFNALILRLPLRPLGRSSFMIILDDVCFCLRRQTHTQSPDKNH